MGWNTREEGVREEILDSPLEESMSTTVNYDKYRDCDAAILEGLERSVSGESWTGAFYVLLSLGLSTESSRGSFGHETLRKYRMPTV